MVFNISEIDAKYHDNLKKLDDIQKHDNLEEYNNFLSGISDKEPLFRIRKIINAIIDCKTEFLLSRADDKASEIDKIHFKELAKLVQHRIDLLNISGNPVETMGFLGQKEVVQLMFEFIKMKTVVLDMTNSSVPFEIKQSLERLTGEIRNIKNHDDEEVKKLDEFLKETFKKLEFNDADDLSQLSQDIQEAIKRAKKINEENERLSKEFNGEFAYVKTCQDICINHPEFCKDDVLQLLKILGKAVSNIKSVNTLVLVGRSNFISNIKKQTSGELLTKGIYKKLSLNTMFDPVLSDLFVNLQLY